jgi:ABC-type microcin C transport system permease subunit YejB
MAFGKHLYLLYMSTSFWTWFFLAGLWTNYYQDVTFINAFIIGIILPSIILIVTGKGLLKSITKTNYLKAAVICASYFGFVLLTSEN